MLLPALPPALVLFVALTLSGTTHALPTRHNRPLDPFGIVVSPKNGFLLEPSEPLHLEYALAHPDATVRVELVSYDPFARAELGEKEARLTLAEFLVGDPCRHRGYIDAWLDIAVDGLVRPYDGKTFKLLVTEFEVDATLWRSYSEPPFIKIQARESREALLSSSAQLVHQTDESREGLVAHYP